MSSRRPVCVVASGGGHISEALKATSLVEPDLITLVTFDLPHLRSSLPDHTHFVHDPHTSFLGYVKNLMQVIPIYFKSRPKVIITTGAGIAIPLCLLGKLFGSKLILIETGARITTPSRTGKLLSRFADKVLVQWEPMTKVYPQAVNGGPLL